MQTTNRKHWLIPAAIVAIAAYHIVVAVESRAAIDIGLAFGWIVSAGLHTSISWRQDK